MKLNKILQYLGVFGVASLLLTACIKEEDHQKEMGAGVGNSFVKFLEAPSKIHYFSPFTEVRTVDLFSLRKDAKDPNSLNTAAKFSLALNPGLVDAFNDENDTHHEIMPDSIYTLANNAFVKSGNGYTVDFSSGDFAKEFTIQLNGAKWDISHTYALGFTITDSANLDINDGKKDIVVIIAVKNKYDGVYRLQGFHNRVPYNFPYDQEIYLVTAGPNSVVFYWPAAGSNGHPIGTGPDPEADVSWYGAAISPVIEFDPATDLVSRVYNNVPGTVITMFTGAGSRLSKFDPATNSITVDWNYNNNPERAFFDDLTYIGPRP